MEKPMKGAVVGIAVLLQIFAGDVAAQSPGRSDAGSKARIAAPPTVEVGAATRDAELFGDWGGLRSRLSEAGLSFEWVYTAEVMSSLAGGDQDGTAYLGNLDLVFSLDAEKALGWRGAEFSLYLLGNHGDSPSEFIGDLQVVSNIDAFETFKVYEAWVEQRLFDDRFSVKAGLIDLNSEFDVIESAGIFLNSSFGIGADYSQSGGNGPSIFPTTSAGVRLNGWLTPSVYARTIILDGVSGDPDDPRGTRVQFDEGDGLLVGGEVGWVTSEGDPGPYRKVAFGGWTYTEPSIEDASGASITPTDNRGYYVLAEGSVYREADGDGGLVLFGRYGSADATINPVSRYVGFGGNYTGLLPGREEDQLGLAMARVPGGDVFRGALRDGGITPTSSETAIELTYTAEVATWLVLRPDLQFVMNPGMDRGNENPWVPGLRVHIVF